MLYHPIPRLQTSRVWKNQAFTLASFDISGKKCKHPLILECCNDLIARKLLIINQILSCKPVFYYKYYGTEVALNKPSLQLKIQLESKQAFQLFTINI
jgi:hypothetical protein